MTGLYDRTTIDDQGLVRIYKAGTNEVKATIEYLQVPAGRELTLQYNDDLTVKNLAYGDRWYSVAEIEYIAEVLRERQRRTERMPGPEEQSGRGS